MLDPVTARLFPTVAAYAKKIQRSAHLLGYGFAFLLGVAVTVLFLGYQLHVATTNLSAFGPRVAIIEAQYERDHKKELTTTKTQANDWAWAKAKKERE